MVGRRRPSDGPSTSCPQRTSAAISHAESLSAKSQLSRADATASSKPPGTRTCAGACWAECRRGRVASAWERRWSGVRAWPRETLRAVSPLSGPMDSSWTAWRLTRPSLGDDARPQPDHRPLENPPGFPQRLGKPLGAVCLLRGRVTAGGWVLVARWRGWGPLLRLVAGGGHAPAHVGFHL